MMNDELIGKKLQLFLKESKALHVDLTNGRFYNGFIQEIAADFFILSDFRIGEVTVFFIEIDHLEPYMPKGSLN